MSLRLLLLAVAVSAVADDPYESLLWPGPARGCTPAAEARGQLKAECALPGARFTVTADAPTTYLRVLCDDDDSTFSCEDLQEAEQLMSAHAVPHVARDQRVIDRLEVKYCALPAPAEPLRCALALVHASGARLLVLDGVRGALTPEHLQGMAALEKLRLYYPRGSNQSTVPYDVLAQLPALSSFSLKGGAVALRPAGAEAPGAPLAALRVLELAEGGLRAVPRAAFRFAPALTTLGLWGNELDDVDEGALDGLPELVNLSLNSNRLASLPRALLRACARLQHVDLYSNQLTALPADLFRGLLHLKEVFIFDNDAPLHLPDHLFANLPSLQHLELRSSSIQNIPEHMFQNSTDLEHLDLSGNNLTSIPVNLFHGLKKLRILNLSYNKLGFLHEKLFGNLEALENLDLRGNLLERLPAGVFAGVKGLQVLNLAANRIDTLDKSLFRGLRQLRELQLGGNRLQRLHRDTFSPITALKILSLANNNITISRQVNTDRFISPELYTKYQLDQISVADDAYEYYSPLRELSQLSVVDLSHNRVQLVCDDWRTMWNIKTLDLSHNQITHLTGYAMVFYSDSVTVDFSHNRVTHFELPALTAGAHPPTSTPTFILDHNPLACDCTLYPYFEMRENNTLAATVVTDNAVCATPVPLSNVPVSQINPEQLVCNDTNCPDDCTCLNRPAKSRVEVDCLKLPPTLLRESSVTHLRLRELADLTQLPSHIKFVDLSALNLTKPPKVTNSIEIDLTKNHLSKIPMDLLKLNCVLHLSSNPIDCSCRNRAELEFLKIKHHLVKDYRNLTCENSLSLSGIDIDTLCTARDSTIIGCTIAFIGIFIAVLTGTAYRYKTEIRILLRKFGLWFGEDEIDDREYDAFISFSHKDEKYVIDTLVPKLESGRNALNLCLHYRDWVIGDYIPSQIARSVENSRRTIIVLSEHFLKSVWAQMEFRAAHGRERLLILMLDDLSTDKNLDPDLRAYISVNTYVKHDDPLVYDRLKDAVLSKRSSFGKKPKDADKPAGLDVHLNTQGQLVNAHAA